MTLNYLVDTIKKIALLQPNVRTATEGDVYDVLNGNPSVKYGVIHLTQTTHRTQEGQDIYGFNIFYIDRLLGDNSNKLQIQSIGKELIYNILKSLDETFDTETSGLTFQPFTEKFNDMCAGVYASVNITSFVDYACAEQYGEYIKPTFQVINNQDITIVDNGTYYPQEGYSGFGKVEVKLDIEDLKEKSYEEGKEVGIEEGKEIQKELLTNITIVDNGTYSNENGYKNVEVNVDVNTYYNRGIEEGKEIGKQEIVDDAQILNVTSNGIYYTKYSDIIEPEKPEEDTENIWGIYDDGSYLHNSAEVMYKYYDTEQVITDDYSFEIWYEYQGNSTGDAWYVLFSEGLNDGDNFQLRFYSTMYFEIYGFGTGTTFGLASGINHIKLQYNSFNQMYDLFLNDNLLGSYEINRPSPTTSIYLNGCHYNNERHINGKFGMFKINGKTIVPTENGFYNVTDDKYLTCINDYEGSYTYINGESEPEPEPEKPEGNLIKTLIVNVESPLKFPNGFVLTKYPLEIDFSNPIFSDMTDFGSFFGGDFLPTKIKNFNPKYNVNCGYFCMNTTDIEFENCDFTKCVSFDSFFAYTTFNNELDVTNLVTNNCYSMKQMFQGCNGQIKGLDSFDTSNVVNMEELFHNTNTNLDGVGMWDTSNVNFLRNAFRNCGSLSDLRNWNWNTHKVYDLDGMFYNCENLEYVFDIDVTSFREVGSMFYGCRNLKEVKFKGNVTFFDKINTTYIFEYCDALEKIYIPQEYANSYTKIIENKPSHTEIVYY